jgi:streptomycin 3"-adenylyltransferase
MKWVQGSDSALHNTMMPQDNMKNYEPINGGHHTTTEQQLDEVLTLVGEVLGPDVVGAYLHGSSVLGGLRPRSDLDILVVSRRPTTRDEKRRLVDRLLIVSRANPPGPRRPVELTIVVQSQIRPWRYPPRFDFQYGDWMRQEFEHGNLEPWPSATNPDLASLITMVLLGNRPLLGPPAAEVLDPVPRGDYLRATVGDIDKLLEDLDWDTRNVILTLARIWSTVATDFIRSKDAAASWALSYLPQEHRLVVARARAIYLGEEDERWDDIKPRIRPCVDYIIGEIRRLAVGASPSDTTRSVKPLR